MFSHWGEEIEYLGTKRKVHVPRKKMSSVLYKFDIGLNTVAQTSIKKHRYIIGEHV